MDKTDENQDIEQLDIVAASVFEHLENYDHDWSEVTKTELKILRDVCNRIQNVPLPLTQFTKISLNSQWVFQQKRRYGLNT